MNVTKAPNGDVDNELAALMRSDPAAMADPFPLWHRLLEAPTYTLGETVFVTRYEEVRSVLQDGSEHYTKNQDRSRSAERFVASLGPVERDAFREYYTFVNQWMVRSDGADHVRLRRIAHRAFTPARIADLRGAIQRYADELLEPYGDSDAVDGMVFAYQLPLMVIVDMLGCPPEDRGRIHDWSTAIGNHLNREDVGTLMAAVRAIREFQAYVDANIAERRGRPPETDLVAALLDAEGDERLTPSELTGMFVLLLFAGHETTTNLIGHGIVELMRDREQWQRLAADPSLAPAATDELLRIVSPVQWLGRVVATDHEIAGVEVAKGMIVSPAIAAANRDGAVFEDPDRLDILRPNSRRHVALGFGPRFCLGAALARLEGEVAFTTLARRFPDLELGGEEFTYTGNAVLRRLAELPLRPGRDHAVRA